MTMNQIGGGVAIVALAAILFLQHHHPKKPKPVPQEPAVIVETTKPPVLPPPVHKPEPPKPIGPVVHPNSHSVKFDTYREVQARGRVGSPITCKSVEPVPEEDVAIYAKNLSLTEAQVRSHRICVQ